MAENPIIGFRVDPADIQYIGQDLQRPECILEKAFVEDRATPEDMLAAGGTIAPWFASVTFGGPDLKTAYIGSFRGTRIPYFQSPVAGLPMVHWE